MITVKEAAGKLGVNDSRVRQLLLEGRIKGAQKMAGVWLLPNNPVIKKPSNPRGRPAKK